MIRYFLLWGAEDEADSEDESDPQPEPEPATKELTADEIEKMTARAADRASRKARKELASEFGFEDLNSMKEWVGSQREAEKEAMDAQTRAIQEAEEAKRQAETLRNNLVSDRLDLAIQRQVIGAGVTDDKKSQRVAALVRLDLDPDIINDEDSWDEAVTAALTAVKEDAPELFSGASPKGYGSGDGGARGESELEKDEEAARTKKLQEEFTGRGLIPYDA